MSSPPIDKWQASLHLFLIAEPTVVAYLGTTQGGPSIFHFAPVPEFADWPVAIIDPPFSVMPLPDKDGKLWEIVQDIRFVQRSSVDEDGRYAVEDLISAASTAVSRLDRGSLDSFDGGAWRVVAMSASGPVGADDEETYTRVVQLTALVEEA